jgi:hypothetical protein
MSNHSTPAQAYSTREGFHFYHYEWESFSGIVFAPNVQYRTRVKSSSRLLAYIFIVVPLARIVLVALHLILAHQILVHIRLELQ